MVSCLPACSECALVAHCKNRANAPAISKHTNTCFRSGPVLNVGTLACGSQLLRVLLRQRCANILQHNCVASEGQSGATMWDSSNVVHSILTGKVRAAPGRSGPCRQNCCNTYNQNPAADAQPCLLRYLASRTLCHAPCASWRDSQAKLQ